MSRVVVEPFGSGRMRAGRAWTPFAPERRFQLLAYLAYVQESVSRTELAHLSWSELRAEAAHRNLRHLLQMQLRHGGDAGLVATRTPSDVAVRVAAALGIGAEGGEVIMAAAARATRGLALDAYGPPAAPAPCR